MKREDINRKKIIESLTKGPVVYAAIQLQKILEKYYNEKYG